MSEQLPSDPRRIAADIARELRERPSAWCQHSYAQASDGTGRAVTDWDACHWCVMGHVKKRTGTNNDQVHNEFRIFFEAIIGEPAARFNDAPGRTVESIIIACDKLAAS